MNEFLLKHYLDVNSLYEFVFLLNENADIFSSEQALRLDESEIFPLEACNKLEEWGIQYYYIPQELGGKLSSFEVLLWLLRVIASKDMTIAIGHGKTFLGASPVWVAGSDHLKRRLSNLISSGNAISLALTEKENGSDLASNNSRISRDHNGFILDGEKWCINNATRSSALSVFVRTNENCGSRNHSLFFLEKNLVSQGSYQHLDKIKTHGIRGADISGIKFDHVPLLPEQLIGKDGDGLEIIMKALQVSRTMCAGLSLGAGDRALRITLNYTLTRNLYNQRLYDLIDTNKKITKAFIDYLNCEALSISISRALHVCPEQMSLYSAIVKYFVPNSIEKVIDDCAQILGSRQFLRESSDCGFFQKVQRDHLLVSLFDGSSIINLQIITEQLKYIVKKYNAHQKQAFNYEALFGIFSISKKLPNFDYSNLKISNHGSDIIMSSLDIASEQLQSIKNTISFKLYNNLNQLIQLLIRERNHLFSEISLLDLSFSRLNNVLEELAIKYTLIFSAICYFYFWIFNRDLLFKHLRNGNVLLSCLSRIVSKCSQTKNEVDFIDYPLMSTIILEVNESLGIVSHFPICSTEIQGQESRGCMNE